MTAIWFFVSHVSFEQQLQDGTSLSAMAVPLVADAIWQGLF
jgi:hypothetical protein